MKKINEGYALILALILIAVFSIVVASVASRSLSYRSSQITIMNKIESDLQTYENCITGKATDCP